MKTLITAWNLRTSEIFDRLLSVLDYLNLNGTIVLCESPDISTKKENISIAEINDLHSYKIESFSTEPFMYQDSLWNSRRRLLQAQYEESLLFYQQNGYSALLQAHRLSVGNLAFPSILNRLEDVYLCWIEYLQVNKIDYVLFTQPAHTGSDYILKIAVKFLKIKYTELYRTLNRPLFYIFDSNDRTFNQKFFSSIEKWSASSRMFSTSDTVQSFFSKLPADEIKQSRSKKSGSHGKQLLLAYFCHSEPECTINPGGGTFITNLRIIKYLDTILPSDVHLIIREHPRMNNGTKKLGWQGENETSSSTYRCSEFWNYIAESPRLALDQSASVADCLKAVDGVITVNGDIQHEAAYLQIPVLVLGRIIVQNTKDRMLCGIFNKDEINLYISNCREPAKNFGDNNFMYLDTLEDNLLPMSSYFHRPLVTEDKFSLDDAILPTIDLLANLLRS